MWFQYDGDLRICYGNHKGNFEKKNFLSQKTI